MFRLRVVNYGALTTTDYQMDSSGCGNQMSGQANGQLHASSVMGPSSYVFLMAAVVVSVVVFFFVVVAVVVFLLLAPGPSFTHFVLNRF